MSIVYNKNNSLSDLIKKPDCVIKLRDKTYKIPLIDVVFNSYLYIDTKDLTLRLVDIEILVTVGRKKGSILGNITPTNIFNLPTNDPLMNHILLGEIQVNKQDNHVKEFIFYNVSDLTIEGGI